MVLAVLLVCAAAGAVALVRPISDFYVAGHAVPAPYNGMAIAACSWPRSLIPLLREAWALDGADRFSSLLAG